jgi:hypothetical protein
MTKEEAAISKEDLVFAVDELNRELLDNAKGDDSISKESGAVMVEELKAASEEVDVDDVFTQRTADVLRALGVKTKFNIKKEKKVSVKTKAKVKTKTVGKRKEKRVPVSKQKAGVKKKVSIVKKGNKKLGIGTFVVENLKNNKFKKLSNEQIVEKVKKKFPEAGTTSANINWYKRKIKKGEL